MTATPPHLRPREPLARWLWRSYLRAALVPLLVIELSFIVIYWGTNQHVYHRGAEALTRLANAALGDAAEREARVIGHRLNGVAQLTSVFADESGRALATPATVDEAEKARHAYSPDGVFYTTRDTGGSAVFYSGIVPVGEAEREKVWRTVRLDPLMAEIKAADPLIAQLYLNTNDSLNRIYPYFPVLEIYPPRMDIPSYNFYYEADAARNPDRRTVWTDAYVDPAGAGWMVSAIAPVYALDRPDHLEAVVGIDITIGTMVAEVLRTEIPGAGYAMLVGRDGTILALPPEAEADWGLPDLGAYSYSEAILQDTFRPEEFNLYRRADLADVATALSERPEGDMRLDLGRPMLASWATVEGTDWKLIVLASEENILAETARLRETLNTVNRALVGVLALFYLGFFAVLWKRSQVMSHRVARPLGEIEGNMLRVAEGGHVRPAHDYEVAEIQRLGDHLVTMDRALQAANRAKSGFLSAMSHELRTPLNAVIGLADLVALSKGRPIDDQVLSHVQGIRTAGWQLLSLLDGVIELAGIEGETSPSSILPVAPVALATAAIAAAGPSAEAAGISLTLDAPPAALPDVLTDAALVGRILSQILANAVNYSGRGGQVVVGFDCTDPARIGIRVRDSGPGIPEDLRAAVFQPFNRGGKENGTISGAGIGLTIAEKLSTRIGATLRLDPATGSGASFTLFLPRA